MPRLRQEDTGGITEHRIDDAGRLTLNVDQRTVFPEGEVHVILWLVDGCLRLCTRERLEELREEVCREWPDRRAQDKALRRTVGTDRVVTIDDAGRIRIPYIYLDFVRLDGRSKKAWLVPLRDGIYELWNPDDYKREMEGDLYEWAAARAGQGGGSQAPGAAGGDKGSGDE